MDAAVILPNLLLCGVLGIIGQAIRVLVGLKKLSTANSEVNDNDKEPFDGKRLLISLLIGFVAGALGYLAKLIANKDKLEITVEFLVAIIAGGYSGVDFIEGIFNLYLPKKKVAQA